MYEEDEKKEIKELAAGQIEPDRIVRTVCSPNCTGSCGINVYVKDEKILKIEPADFPDKRYRRICLKGISNALQRVYHPDRAKYPMRRRGERGEGRWERISWDEAFDCLADKLTEISKKYGPEANSWMSMTGNYGIIAMTLSMRIANYLEGTLFSMYGIMGDLAANMGFQPTLGVLQEAHEYGEMIGSKFIMMFGCNFAETALNDIHFLFDAIEKGAKLIVVDPRYSRTATKAHQWVSIRPGTDAALILSMIKVVIDEKLYDENYLKENSNAPFLVREDNKNLLRENDIVTGDADGYLVWDTHSNSISKAKNATDPQLRGRFKVTLKDGTSITCKTAFETIVEACKFYTLEEAEKICEVPANVIRDLAIEYASSSPASLWISQGTQRYYHGHLSYRAVITLAAMCGNIGRRYAGVNWVNGGTLARLISGLPPSWLSPSRKMGKVYPGTRIYDIIPSEKPYPIKSLWLLQYGMGTQMPRRNEFLKEILPNLELFVVTEQIMTHAAKYADIVLPCVSYYEEEADIVGSWNSWWVQYRKQAIKPMWEAKSDWEIFKGLCERMGIGGDWQMTAEERCKYILDNAVDPIFSKIDWNELKQNGIARALVDDPYIPFKDLKFPTPSGKIELYTESLKEYGQEVPVFVEPLESNRKPKAKEYPLTFMSVHHVNSAHSQHTVLPWIREVAPEPRLEMHPNDAEERGIIDGDLVNVYNDRGNFKVKVILTEAIKQGVLSLCEGWWPEHFVEGHFSDITHMTINPVQEAIPPMHETNYAFNDNLVEVKKEKWD